jgi:catechol 2,3-dioxygenase-like lactoylglutathione lyase family enzyme
LSQVVDHVSLGIGNLERAQGFYDAVLDALGVGRLYRKPRLATYGLDQGSDCFSIVHGRDGASRPGAHVAFRAESKEAVDHFHAAALAQRGKNDGSRASDPKSVALPRRRVESQFS